MHGRMHARNGTDPTKHVSVNAWVEHQVSFLSTGQLPWEGAMMLRAEEQASVEGGGALTPFIKLPLFLQSSLCKEGMGSAFWRKSSWQGYESPLHAILSVLGTRGALTLHDPELLADAEALVDTGTHTASGTLATTGKLNANAAAKGGRGAARADH